MSAVLRPMTRWLLAGLALACSFEAVAQYQWKDENGRMVFSDKSPPSHVKPSQMIRADPIRSVAPPTPATTTAAAGTDTNAGKATAAESNRAPARGNESLADKELDAKRKAQEKTELDRKRKEETDRDAKLAKVCDDMRSEWRALESGMRIARVNAQGEREYLNDDERNKRMDSVRKDLKESCKPA